MYNKASLIKTKIPTRRLQQAIVETQVKVRIFSIMVMRCSLTSVIIYLLLTCPKYKYFFCRCQHSLFLRMRDLSLHKRNI